MSRVIETLHSGHRKTQTHLKARSRVARQAQLVAASQPAAAACREPHDSLVLRSEQTPPSAVPAAPASDAPSSAGPADEDVADLQSIEVSTSTDATDDSATDNPPLESPLDTLWKLETIRPFDRLESDRENEPIPVIHSPTPGRVLTLNFDTTAHEREAQPPESPTTVAASFDEPADEIAPSTARRRFRVHQTTPLSLESEQTDDVPADRPSGESSTGKEAWAANVLAVCGGLLILAAILYVTVDVIFWF
jgi:hypothetical protein